jgi:hypothetical protein
MQEKSGNSRSPNAPDPQLIIYWACIQPWDVPMGSEPCLKLMLEVLGAELSLISPQAADDTRMMRAQGFLLNQIISIALLIACACARLAEEIELVMGISLYTWSLWGWFFQYLELLLEQLGQQHLSCF